METSRHLDAGPARLLLLMLLALLLGLCRPGAAMAQEAAWPGRVGRVVEVQGSVRLLDRTENEWIEAAVNRPLTTGDRLASAPGARAEWRIGSTTLRLDGDTELELQRLDDQAIVLLLHSGSLALKVASQEVLGQIEVLTPEGRLRPLQTGHYRIDRRGEATEATSWRGELQFEGRDSRLQIAAGRRAELWLQGPGQATHYRWSEVERDGFADWVAYDDQQAERSVSQQYVSPEMTGWEDLDRHGQWQTHPEYGGVWIPTRVAADWAPYRSGHWAWIAPWGWTWVDQARWGFAPFHYGRWVYWNHRWCWTPGPRVHRPMYAPALVGWIGGPHLHTGVRVGGPPVAWVPLGPHDHYRPHPGWRDQGGWGRRDDRRDGRRDDRRDERHGPGYGNQHVPGAVTVVTNDTFRQRRPIVPVPAAARQVGTTLIGTEAPPAPVVPQPGRVRPPMPWRDDAAAERRGGGAATATTPAPAPMVPVAPMVRPDVPPPRRAGRDGEQAGRPEGSTRDLNPRDAHPRDGEGTRSRQDPDRVGRPDAGWTARPDGEHRGSRHEPERRGPEPGRLAQPPVPAVPVQQPQPQRPPHAAPTVPTAAPPAAAPAPAPRTPPPPPPARENKERENEGKPRAGEPPGRRQNSQ